MPLRADVLVTDHPAPRDALRPGTGPAGHRSGWAPVRLGTGPAGHRSGGRRCTGGLVLSGPSVHPSLWGPCSRRVATCPGARTAPHSGAPPPVASNPSYQACTFSLPGQVRQNPASARLPRLVARGYTGLAVTGLLSVSSFYDGSAGL